MYTSAVNALSKRYLYSILPCGHISPCAVTYARCLKKTYRGSPVGRHLPAALYAVSYHLRVDLPQLPTSSHSPLPSTLHTKRLYTSTTVFQFPRQINFNIVLQFYSFTHSINLKFLLVQLQFTNTIPKSASTC